MYTRSDDPKDHPHRNLIALGVLLLIAALGAGLVVVCWNLAQEHSKLGNSEVSEAIQTASTAQSIDDIAAERGLSATGDSVTTVMFVVVSGGENSTKTLSGLNFAVLNETQNFAKLLEIPIDSYISGNGATETFAGWYSAGGIESLAMRIASSGVPVNHIVVMSDSGWESFMTVASEGSSALQSNATELLEGIEQSDMDITALVNIMSKAIEAGLSTSSIEAVPTVENTDDNGNTSVSLDSGQIPILAGTMA